MKAKISVSILQKKYGGQFVLLSKDQKQVLAAEKNPDSAFKKLKKTGKDITDVVIAGYVPKYGAVSVYKISLSVQKS